MWKIITVTEVFQKSTLEKLCRQAIFCPFRDNLIPRNGAISVQVLSLLLAGWVLSCVATRLLKMSSSIVVYWLALTWVQRHSYSVLILKGSSTYLFPQTSSSPVFQPLLFQGLHHQPNHQPLPRSHCGWMPLATSPSRQSE